VSYRDPLDPFGRFCVHYFANFNEAREHVSDAQLSEYSIARASLEDVYFTLTGEHFAQEDTESA